MGIVDLLVERIDSTQSQVVGVARDLEEIVVLERSQGQTDHELVDTDERLRALSNSVQSTVASLNASLAVFRSVVTLLQKADAVNPYGDSRHFSSRPGEVADRFRYGVSIQIQKVYDPLDGTRTEIAQLVRKERIAPVELVAPIDLESMDNSGPDRVIHSAKTTSRAEVVAGDIRRREQPGTLAAMFAFVVTVTTLGVLLVKMLWPAV